jgi:hypothetical protein
MLLQGNFYHSQAVIMLFGRREPLYMLVGCYGWIAYIAMALAKKLGGSSLHVACYAALFGSEAWALLDTVGAQFLWYVNFSFPFCCCQKHAMQSAAHSSDAPCALFCRSPFNLADCFMLTGLLPLIRF